MIDVDTDATHFNSLPDPSLRLFGADGTEFADLAAAHSSCPSGQRGGDLGSFSPGMMVPSEINASHYADVELLTGFLTDEDLRERLRAANSSRELLDALMVGQYEPAINAEASQSS